MNQNFVDGFYKESEEKKKEHKLRRLIMGNHLSAAIEAKPGHKVEAFRKASIHAGKEALKGAGVGGVIGGLAGAGIGALKGGKDLAKNMGLLGFGAGAGLGTNVGFIKGNIDSKASKIHSEYSKHKK